MSEPHLHAELPADSRRLLAWVFGCATNGCYGTYEIRFIGGEYRADVWICKACGLVQMVEAPLPRSPLIRKRYEVKE